MNDQMVEVLYQYQKEDIPISPNLNIFVACFTTCWARLKLYEALEQLGERVLYYDTDSVIYLEEPGQPCPVLGNYLGDFTSELADDDFIVEFVGWSQELWLPNQEGKDRIQSDRFSPQQRRKNAIKLCCHASKCIG